MKVVLQAWVPLLMKKKIMHSSGGMINCVKSTIFFSIYYTSFVKVTALCINPKTDCSCCREHIRASEQKQISSKSCRSDRTGRTTLTHFSFSNIWHCQQQLKEMTTITSSSGDRNIQDLSPIGKHIDLNIWNKTKRFSKWVQREIKWKEKSMRVKNIWRI